MPSLKGVVLTYLAAASHLVSAWPTQHPEHVNILTRAERIASEYDYVIVGGGTSGLTVGDRLTEDGKYTVLVVEYGFYDSQTGMNPRRMFNITSKPCPNLNGRSFSVGIGCVVGGSSNVNGQVFLRGTKDEYNAWKELGGPGSTWDWDNLLPYFKKGITLAAPDANQAREYNIAYDPNYWGTTSKIYAAFGKGPLQSSISPSLPPLPPPFSHSLTYIIQEILYNAMAKMPGMTIPPDSGAGEAGLYWYPMSQDPVQFQRSYARTGHWDGLNRANYEMIVGAKVNRILFDGDTATGVQFVSRNSTGAAPVQVRARREVILAAGSVHTPQVLMLSGIGPKAHLDQARIPVKVDLPGVGSNFQDHSYIPSISYQWGIQPPNSGGGGGWGGGGPPSLASMIGMPVVSPDRYEALARAYEAQDPRSHLPSTYTSEQIEGYRQQQKVYGRLMRSKNTVFSEMMMYGPGGSVQNLHCMSRGNILLNTGQPEAEMIVDYRAASNAIDLDVMAEIIKFMRRYMTTGDLAQYQARETSPGAGASTDAQLVNWARGQIIPSVYHPVGTTAKMPREWGGVLDENLMVYGVKKLRVVDASMMPTTVGATTSMTVYAVAEKAADMIKAQTQ
ncbi:Oxygen-dependent choline dehydrogenase 5 [Colletotrichum sojae]|uniref:Oxygen-dependent choline dehydrogenase 5 n=1 Tax=Colletotrichum sojae TaxID=2175907 RepID=A0A8H6JC74_9PEZI|nr:Oxygen-dependent choline dehydrogenase 5 [Colletotrichum sojae]